MRTFYIFSVVIASISLATLAGARHKIYLHDMDQDQRNTMDQILGTMDQDPRTMDQDQRTTTNQDLRII